MGFPAGRSAGVAGECWPASVPGGDGGAVASCEGVDDVGVDGVGVPLGSCVRGGVGASRAESSGIEVGAGRLGGDDGEDGEEQPSICGICLFLASTAARLLARVASPKVFARV